MHRPQFDHKAAQPNHAKWSKQFPTAAARPYPSFVVENVAAGGFSEGIAEPVLCGSNRDDKGGGLISLGSMLLGHAR
jgi:hypothetical protein